MKWSNGISWRWLLLSAFLCVGLQSWCQQAAGPTPSSQQRTQSISQLKDSLTQALSLCTTLQQNLALRVASFQVLQDSYSKLVQTQQQLQSQIATLQKNLNSSDQQLQQAQADLQATKELSAKLQTSLNAASQSLAAYKSDTDKAVRDVTLQRDAWKYGAIAAAVVVVGETIYLMVKK